MEGRTWKRDESWTGISQDVATEKKHGRDVLEEESSSFLRGAAGNERRYIHFWFESGRVALLA